MKFNCYTVVEKRCDRCKRWWSPNLITEIAINGGRNQRRLCESCIAEVSKFSAENRELIYAVDDPADLEVAA